MANGLYGQTIPASITTNDVEIWYTYSKTRNTVSDSNAIWKRLSSNILREQTRETINGEADDVMEGMYKLNLPVSVFNKVGFYSVYIKPKEVIATIKDISTLHGYNDVTGIVIDSTSVSDEDRYLFTTDDALVGYRIVYFNKGTKERANYVRLVTSNHLCEQIVEQMRNSTGKATVYRYNRSSTLSFITMTPSMATYSAPTIVPFIGEVGQQILFMNTKFTPIHLDIHVVENDADTITTHITGNQVLNLDNGLTTVFTDDGVPFTQYQTTTIKNEYTGQPIKRVRINRSDNIDTSETLD